MSNTNIASLTSSGYGNQTMAALTSGKMGPMSMEKIEATSKDFEALFIGQMMEQMFGDSIGTEAFGDEESGEIYKGLMMEEYGRQMAKAGGIGIADYVKRELMKLQEA